MVVCSSSSEGLAPATDQASRVRPRGASSCATANSLRAGTIVGLRPDASKIVSTPARRCRALTVALVRTPPDPVVSTGDDDRYPQTARRHARARPRPDLQRPLLRPPARLPAGPPPHHPAA